MAGTRNMFTDNHMIRHVFNLWADCRVRSGLVLVLIFSFIIKYCREPTGNERRERSPCQSSLLLYHDYIKVAKVNLYSVRVNYCNMRVAQMLFCVVSRA